MEINVKVNVEFGERTLKVLEGLGKVYAVVQPKEEEKKAVKAVKEVQKTEPKSEPETDPEPEKETVEITFEEFRAKFADKNTSANQSKLKKLINDLGFEKLSQIPEEKYAEALELLEAI